MNEAEMAVELGLADVARDLAAKVPLAMRERPVMPRESTRGLLDDAANSYYGFEPRRLRLSYGKRCWREKWYQHHESQKAERPDGISSYKMALGKFTEILLVKDLQDFLRREDDGWTMPEEWREREVEWNGIAGHCDAALFLRSKPVAIVDMKTTKEWSVKQWGQDSEPDPMWGYPHQAADYLAAARAEGILFAGFIWLVVGLKENSIGTVVGRYMTAEDALKWEREAARGFAAGRGPRIPQRINPGADALPCCSKTGVSYCDFLTHCREDKRVGEPVTYEV